MCRYHLPVRYRVQERRQRSSLLLYRLENVTTSRIPIRLGPEPVVPITAIFARCPPDVGKLQGRGSFTGHRNFLPNCNPDRDSVPIELSRQGPQELSVHIRVP